MSAVALLQTDLPLPLVRRGKVRDVYEVDADRLLLVTTDRISAFDVVMHEAIPYKGVVLTQLTAWWLEQLTGRLEHHLISADTNAIIAAVPALAPYRDALAGRSMLTLKADVIPIECVIRGYITGSAWKEYQSTGTLAGEALATGLRESDRLSPAIFSPATKAETGHDENITIGTMVRQVGADTAATLERLARSVYEFGRATAEPRGIILADTKFEFGWRNGSLLLIDEVLTPDSSRFWPADTYEPGHGQPSFDKQPLRDWLDVERKAGRWNGEAPPPTLPPEVIRTTSLRYRDAFLRLTGAPLDLARLGLPEDR
ncbi:phosphoribosylaminoimidazolesuccinocarboxamide synthase [Gemmatimonas sp.]|jgi:phosphoribosylaminoimidazole-succinocarboxamide synthase|uniref:phosphoribosylaminoimidazolesuccinocarboxamide synthase n=1 Tax=Gemmatimonas sp. TaxID=1962908 RepID=UPI0037C17ABA